MLYKIHKRLTRHVVRQWIKESEQLFPKHSTHGITFCCSDQLLPVLELTFVEVQRKLPDVYDLIVEEIRTIYAHPRPMGWIGFGNNCAFITSEEEELTAFIWKECAGYLAVIAKINELIKKNQLSVLFKYSKARKQIDEFERDVIEKLSE